MAIQFPAGPFIGDTFPYEGMVYTYDGEKWTAATDKAYWDKTGDDLIPKEPGDNVDLGTGDLSANNAEFDGNGTFAGTVKSETDSGTWTAIYKDGAAEGYNSGSQTWFLQSDGSASFAGGDVIITDTETNFGDIFSVDGGTRILNRGELYIRQDNAGFGVMSVASGGTGGSDQTFSLTAGGKLKLGQEDIQYNGAEFQGITGYGSNGQLIVQGSSSAGSQVQFAVYKGNSRQFEVYNDGAAWIGGQIICPNLTSSGSAGPAIKYVNTSLVKESSSLRYKTSVESADSNICLDIVKNSRPVWYRSTCEMDDPELSYWGFIAEEVAEVSPRLCSYNTEGEPESVDYARYTPVLTSVLQQALTRIEALEEKIQVLEGGAATADVTPEA